jgi:hypothetical protein
MERNGSLVAALDMPAIHPISESAAAKSSILPSGMSSFAMIVVSPKSYIGQEAYPSSLLEEGQVRLGLM